MAPTKPKSPAANPPADEKPAPRSFRLRAAADGAEPHDVINRVDFGHDPRVSIGAGEIYVTADEKLAARLAADPNLEEVTK